MAKFAYSNVEIKGLAVSVPKMVFDNRKDNPYFSEAEIENIIRKTGIEKRRIASKDVCSSDLCFSAAENLLEEMAVDRSTIDVLIFVSQTPDYKMPATGITLQDRLGLEQACAAFDVNLGCSGFVYGLNLAFNLALHPNIRRVLLLNGETRTKVYSMKDKKTGLLFGDAGSACLVEKTGKKLSSFFCLRSDGSRSHYIMIPAGGYRKPTTFESLIEKQYEDGSIRTEEHGVMDGSAVFDFSIRDVPKNIQETLEFSKVCVDELDYVILHQANQFITNHIAKKLSIPLEKVPHSLDRYGNTSSVSIPLTMVSEIAGPLQEKHNKILISGFGVGLSWGTAILETNKVHISPIIEV